VRLSSTRGSSFSIKGKNSQDAKNLKKGHSKLEGLVLRTPQGGSGEHGESQFLGGEPPWGKRGVTEKKVQPNAEKIEGARRPQLFERLLEGRVKGGG